MNTLRTFGLIGGTASVACLAAVAGMGLYPAQAEQAASRPTPTVSASATPTSPAKPRPPAPAPRHTGGKVAYLTFDDGPNPTYTPQVLALLKRYDAHATFFMIGSAAKANPSLVKRVRAEGHVVGNHTYSHPWLTHLNAGGVRDQLRRTDAAVGRTTCMRPPGGFVNNTVRNVAAAEGKRVVMWSVDPSDWARPGVQNIIGRIVPRTHVGSIVLMHDGGGPRTQTVTALATVLSRLSAQGYRFETLPACR